MILKTIKVAFWQLFLCAIAFAQPAEPFIRVTGIVSGNDPFLPVVNVMAVNKNSGNGVFGNSSNLFSVTLSKTDTLLVTAAGYSVKKICFADSVFKSNYTISIELEKPFIALKPVTIISQRDIENIQKDIEKLGYKKEDYQLTGIDAFQSPITFLYQQFSRREKAKREIAQRINEDKKRALLKELFRKYVDGQIMDLTEPEFDDFIDFINVSDEFLKSSGQYDFIIFVKRKFEIYRAVKK